MFCHEINTNLRGVKKRKEKAKNDIPVLSGSFKCREREKGDRKGIA